MRGRRPGRTIVAPSPEMATLDRTITHVGSTTVATIDWMDNVLRRVAAATTDGHLPSLIAVELATDEMTLHLDQPMPAPQPWKASGDQKRWTLPTDTDLDDVGPHAPDHEAPWPMLVTIGAPKHAPGGCSTSKTSPLRSPATNTAPKPSPATWPPSSPSTPGRATPACT